LVSLLWGLFLTNSSTEPNHEHYLRSTTESLSADAVAVAALTESGHEGMSYELTAPQALTHAEMAAHLSRALGRQVAFVDISPEAMRDTLLSVGFPVWQADGLLEEYALYRGGEAAAVTSGVRDAIGKAPRSFEAFARDYAAMFV
jgi:uncharacterized protein YbjT (DUF2867 family)